jgi:hypothetical protein
MTNQPRPAARKRPADKTRGAKMLITATSIALTVGGWAALSAHGNNDQASVSALVQAQASSPSATDYAQNYALDATALSLPTIGPVPTLVTLSSLSALPSGQAANSSGPQSPAAIPTPIAVPQAQAPAPKQPALRSVVPPQRPAPITVTRSSR